MALSALSARPPVAGLVLQQVQQQQAQRNADQAALAARSLQAQARAAQSVAARAQENARSLTVEAEQAGSRSDQAQQGLAAFRSTTALQSGFDDLRQQISSVIASDFISTTPSTPTSVINTSGQETGTLINVTA